jgi:hypothetical protein
LPVSFNFFFKLPRITTSQYVILFNDLWWFCRGCSPLPIPNREVKPLMADGTAPQCGRVGSCHILLKASSIDEAFFILCPSPSHHRYPPNPRIPAVSLFPAHMAPFLHARSTIVFNHHGPDPVPASPVRRHSTICIRQSHLLHPATTFATSGNYLSICWQPAC